MTTTAIRSVSYVAIADDDAIKTSIATVHSGVSTYTGAGLTGVIGAAVMNPPREFTVKTSTHTGTYNIVDPIVVIGLDGNGQAQTESIHLTAVNGNETVASLLAWSKITSVAVPIQVDTLGTFKLGVRDIVCTTAPTKIRAVSAGNLQLGYADGSVDLLALAAGETVEDLSPTRIYGNAATTAANVTLFF